MGGCYVQWPVEINQTYPGITKYESAAQEEVGFCLLAAAVIHRYSFSLVYYAVVGVSEDPSF